MSEAENKKPAISKIAVTSIGLVILGLCALYVLLLLRESNYKEFPAIVGPLVVCLFIATGAALGVIADSRIRKSKGTLRGRIFSTSAFIVTIIVILTGFIIRPARRIPQSLLCGSNLAGFGKIMLLYADDHYEQYPNLNKWCDLVANYDVTAKQYLCPEAVKHDDKGPCHYAMNPNCEPNSPVNIVLLFETKGGWNQHGGIELLTFDNHGGKGANVLFNNGHVEFVKPDEVGKLKWKVENH